MICISRCGDQFGLLMGKFAQDMAQSPHLTYNALIKRFPNIKQLISTYKNQLVQPAQGKFWAEKTRQAIKNYLQYIGIDGMEIPEIAEIIM